MSLTKAVRFRHLVDQLTPTEFNQFLSKVNKNVILNSLFSYFTNSKASANRSNQIDNIIQIISHIIRSRKDKPIQPQITNINELNSNIIGKISSYLHQKDYALFSMATRSIFIGCNSPNTLQQIHLDLFNIPYSSIHLQLTPSVKYLSFNAEKFHEINFVSINNNLEHLRIKDLFYNRNTFEKFMKGDVIDFDRIKRLDFIVPYNKTDAGGLLRFFSKFKMIEHLELDEKFSRGFVGIETKNSFANLKSFCSNGSQFGISIINKYSNQLQRLKFKDNNGVSAFTKFEKLTELTIFDAKPKTIRYILKSAKNLKKFKMSCKKFDDMQKVIEKVFSTQLLLHYINIICSSDSKQLAVVFSGIEKGLFQVKKQKKMYFKSKIKIECKTEIGLSDIILYLSRIKNVLQLSNVKDFMLLCVLCGDRKPDKNEINMVVKDYLDCESGVMVYSVDEYEKGSSMIAMTNNNCAINGYSESML